MSSTSAAGECSNFKDEELQEDPQGENDDVEGEATKAQGEVAGPASLIPGKNMLTIDNVKKIMIDVKCIKKPLANNKSKIPRMVPGQFAYFNFSGMFISEKLDSLNEVYPNIYIGNVHAASDKELLKQNGITHIVNAAHGTKFNQINTTQEFYNDVGMTLMAISGAMDIAKYNMAKHFDETVNFMRPALKNNGKVFVHCQQGISRSSTLVISYLMIEEKLPLVTVLKTVRQHRPIWPNDGFLQQLIDLNDKLF